MNLIFIIRDRRRSYCDLILFVIGSSYLETHAGSSRGMIIARYDAIIDQSEFNKN